MALVNAVDTVSALFVTVSLLFLPLSFFDRGEEKGEGGRDRVEDEGKGKRRTYSPFTLYSLRLNGVTTSQSFASGCSL